jgi:hypothetical protein
METYDYSFAGLCWGRHIYVVIVKKKKFLLRTEGHFR